MTVAHTDAFGRIVCPTCGNALVVFPPVTDDEVMCAPATCPRWETTGWFDHDSGEWLPVDLDGHVPDGRSIFDHDAT